eukprot:9170327-Karenia_brevis.AAC.1
MAVPTEGGDGGVLGITRGSPTPPPTRTITPPHPSWKDQVLISFHWHRVGQHCWVEFQVALCSCHPKCHEFESQDTG